MVSTFLFLLLLLSLALFELLFYKVLSRSSLSFHISDTLLEFIQIGANILPFALHLALLSLSHTQLHLQSLDLPKDLIASLDVIPDFLTLLLQLFVSMP